MSTLADLKKQMALLEQMGYIKDDDEILISVSSPTGWNTVTFNGLTAPKVKQIEQLGTEVAIMMFLEKDDKQ